MISQLINCFHIELSNGEKISYTDHSDIIDIENLIFENSKEFTIIGSAVNVTGNIEADTMTVAINFTSESKWFMQTVSGLLDNALVTHYKVDILPTPHKKLLAFKGYIKEVSLLQFAIIATIKSLKSKFEEASIGEFYSPYCRASFGDLRCKVAKAQYSMQNTIKSILDNHTLSLAIPPDTSKFIPNAISIPKYSSKDIGILSIQNDIITLKDTIPLKTSKGDEIMLYLVCDNKYETCYKVFNNIKNFRGEPFIL